ncbi:MAG: hypothetical protein LBJ96_02985 [Holosporaceae bacterium]|jgi:hypothetical protein|nr:hypothetical protein [Holosporaceae bacterium]
MINIFSRVLVGMGAVLAVPVCQGMVSLVNLSVGVPITAVMQALGVSVTEGYDTEISGSSSEIKVKVPGVSSLPQVFDSVSVPEGLMASGSVSVSMDQGVGCVSIKPSLSFLRESLSTVLPGGCRFSVMGSVASPAPGSAPRPRQPFAHGAAEANALLNLPENSAYKAYNRSAPGKEWSADVELVGSRFGEFTCGRLRSIVRGAMGIAKQRKIALEINKAYASREATLMITIRDNREQFREIFNLMPENFAKTTSDDVAVHAEEDFLAGIEDL